MIPEELKPIILGLNERVRTAIDQRELPVVRYDGESDSLQVRIAPEKRSGPCVQIDGDLYLQLADDRRSAVGFYMENFQRRVLTKYPDWVDYLDRAIVSRPISRFLHAGGDGADGDRLDALLSLDRMVSETYLALAAD